jgi:hypothetical protein
MLTGVTFNVVKSDVYGMKRLCGLRNFKRRRRHAPYVFFYHMLSLCWAAGCLVSGVINFRLEHVIITKGLWWLEISGAIVFRLDLSHDDFFWCAGWCVK